MLKKTLVGTAVAVILSVFVFGKDVLSYAQTSASSVRNAVKSEVPIEFELERAREMVEDLVPDIRRCMHVIAEQQVDVEHLSVKISQRSQELASQKKQVLVLRQDLSGGGETFVYASRTYTSNEVKRDLATRFERYKAAQESLLRDRQILAAREKALLANQKKLDEMLAAKQNLQVELEQLDARLRTVQAAETVSMLEIDDSQLTRTKKLIRELSKQLDVKVKLLDAEGKFTGLIPVDAENSVPVNIGQEIDEYFGPQNGSQTNVAELEPVAEL